MYPAFFPANLHAGWLQGLNALPCPDKSAFNNRHLLFLCYHCGFSTLLCKQIYYPAFPTLVGSQTEVSTVLSEYFYWSSFCATVLVGGRWQGWFPLTESPWKPPCCASYLCRAPTNLSWHQFPLAHLLAMSFLNVQLHASLLQYFRQIKHVYHPFKFPAFILPSLWNAAIPQKDCPLIRANTVRQFRYQNAECEKTHHFLNKTYELH